MKALMSTTPTSKLVNWKRYSTLYRGWWMAEPTMAGESTCSHSVGPSFKCVAKKAKKAKISTYPPRMAKCMA